MDNSQVTVSHAITKTQLNSLGIDLPDDQMDALIQHAEETIGLRIGEEVADSLDEAQLEQLIAMQENNVSPEEIDEWLSERVADYAQIVEDNVAIILGELVENTAEIVDSSNLFQLAVDNAKYPVILRGVF